MLFAFNLMREVVSHSLGTPSKLSSDGGTIIASATLDPFPAIPKFGPLISSCLFTVICSGYVDAETVIT